MFFFERRSFIRWLMVRITLWGWGLVLLSVALRMSVRIPEDAFTNLPGT
jgi:hypothetical protein